MIYHEDFHFNLKALLLNSTHYKLLANFSVEILLSITVTYLLHLFSLF